MIPNSASAGPARNRPRNGSRSELGAPNRAAHTSREWCEFFRRNGATPAHIPWSHGVRLTPGERSAISASVQAFQLGETGTGRHLLRLAAEHAARVGDPEYVEAVQLFIGEEHRHAAWLGRFLDAAGVQRIAAEWTDGIFRRLRHLAGLELMLSALLTAELMALVYYAALGSATECRVLRAICRRILRDEVAHIRFQTERLSLLRRGFGSWRRAASRLGDRLLFAATSLAVWCSHRRALRAGGIDFRGFQRRAWKQFATARRMMSGPQVGRRSFHRQGNLRS